MCSIEMITDFAALETQIVGADCEGTEADLVEGNRDFLQTIVDFICGKGGKQHIISRQFESILAKYSIEKPC